MMRETSGEDGMKAKVTEILRMNKLGYLKKQGEVSISIWFSYSARNKITITTFVFLVETH